jgi:hypothetical protein
MPTQTAPEKGQEGNTTQAVAITKPHQMGLFAVDTFNNNAKVAAVFGVKEVKGKDLNGIEIKAGGNMVPMKRSEIAANLEIPVRGNREVIDAAIRDAQTEGMRLAKGHIAKLGANWLLKQFKSRLVKDNGEMVEELTVRMRNLPPRDRAMAIKYMVAMGWSPEEAAREVDAKSKPPITVETTVTATKPAK